MIAGFAEAFLKEVVTEATCLRESIHSAGATNVYSTIVSGFPVEFVFLYDFLQDVAELYLGKFRLFEGCHEVEVGKVNTHETRTWCGNHAVEEYFDEDERGRVGANIVRIVDEVASHGCASADGLLLFISHRADEFDVDDIFEAITGDFGFGDKFNGVGAFYASTCPLC